jgi:hypothetical protein
MAKRIKFLVTQRASDEVEGEVEISLRQVS